MATDVGQGTGARPALIAPGDRRGRVQRVVTPVVPVEMDQVAHAARGEFPSDLLDGRSPAVGVPDRSHLVGSTGGLQHCLGVGERPGERLLAQHMFAGGEQSLDHLAVQMVGHHDTHGIDVVGLGDRPPVVFGALIAVAADVVVGDGGIGVGDGDEPDIGVLKTEQRSGGAISGRMRAAGHPATDHDDTDRVALGGFSGHFTLALLVSVRCDGVASPVY